MYDILSEEETEQYLAIRYKDLDSLSKIESAKNYKKDIEFLLYVINRLDGRLTDLRKTCEVNQNFINFDVISFKEDIFALLHKHMLFSSGPMA